MPRLATILVPTHDHGQLLRLSVGSATAQTVHDLDIVIVGDGMTEETAEAAREVAAGDPRVRLIEHPKGARHGEVYRHAILQESESRYVFYLSDDDLWFPEHVETLVTLMEDHDAHFGHSLPTSLLADGTWAKANVDLAMEFHRDAMLGGFNRVGLSLVGHTLESYRRLPHGWRTTPAGTPTDLHMWTQWLEQPWARFASSRVPTVLNFPSPLRKDLEIAERASELEAHLPVLHDPGARRDWLLRVIADDFPRAAWLETHWQGLEKAAELREEALRWHQEQLQHWIDQAQRLRAEGDELRAAADRLPRANGPNGGVRRPRALPRRLRQLAGRLGDPLRAVREDAAPAPAAAGASGGAAAAAADVPPVRFPPGHYYSSMYDARELVREPARSRIWPPEPHDHPGIDWNPRGQRSFMRDVLARQQRLELRVDGDPDDGVYYAANGQYPPLDAWILEGVLRHLRPSTMIEVGSGFSSLITAQVNREHFDAKMHFTCIEPYPRGFLQRGVEGITELVAQKVEDVELGRFEALQAGDVLFIDTSHVVRTGGDVVWLYGRVLPRLRPGVHVHIHDVFLPGDYPEQWVREGWGWNENYLVEAFLQFNSGYDIVLGARWALLNARKEVDLAFPQFAHSNEKGGGALWLRRT